jgi:ATP-dependent Lon protease
VKKGLEIVPVSRMDQVLEHALTRMPDPIEWDEAAADAALAAKAVIVADEDAVGQVAH